MKESARGKKQFHCRRIGAFCLLLCICLSQLMLTGCVGLSSRFNAELPPDKRFFCGVETLASAHNSYWGEPLLPEWLWGMFLLCGFPFELAGDIVFLPYDLYVNGKCAQNPNVGYCIYYHQNDKLQQLLDSGAKATECGAGLYSISLTPEEAALKYKNLEALPILWSHGLKITQKSVHYLSQSGLDKEVHWRYRKMDDKLKDFDFCNAALKQIAEQGAWNQLLNGKSEQEFLANYIYFSIQGILEEIHFERQDLAVRKPEIEQAIADSLELMLNHGLNPNRPAVKKYNRNWCPRRGTMLDYVIHKPEISPGLRQRLVSLLVEHGALTYTQLVRENPDLPHLKTDGIMISPVFQPVIDVLENSPYAECYRLSNSHPGFSGEVLVVEAGLYERGKPLRYTYEIPAVEREHPETTATLELPFLRMVFYPIASEEEYNHRQRKDVNRPTAGSCMPPRWVWDDYDVRCYFLEEVHSFPQFELYIQHIKQAYKNIPNLTSPRWYTSLDVKYALDDMRLMFVTFSNPDYTGKEQKWHDMRQKPKRPSSDEILTYYYD
ncbi:MAG: hypothetical protein IKS83_08290 [Victivallales bacterium]|nr:hypothetical protein [Victivallales bacterium]